MFKLYSSKRHNNITVTRIIIIGTDNNKAEQSVHKLYCGVYRLVIETCPTRNDPKHLIIHLFPHSTVRTTRIKALTNEQFFRPSTRSVKMGSSVLFFFFCLRRCGRVTVPGSRAEINLSILSRANELRSS